MNLVVFVLCSDTFRFKAERDLKLTWLSALISHYLAKFKKHNKSNTAFLHEIVITFLQIYLSAALMWLAEAATRGILCKKVFLEISPNAQENTCARVSFLIKVAGPQLY